MKWEAVETQAARDDHVIVSGNLRLAVSPGYPEQPAQQWQHVILQLGEFSEQSREACLRTWPREALVLARQELDKFEAKLNEDESDGVL